MHSLENRVLAPNTVLDSGSGSGSERLHASLFDTAACRWFSVVSVSEPAHALGLMCSMQRWSTKVGIQTHAFVLQALIIDESWSMRDRPSHAE